MPSSSFHWWIVKLRDILLAFAVIAVTTMVLFLLREHLSPSIIALLYLLPVLISTTLWGLWPGIFSAFIAFLAYNYFFLTPYYTFAVHQSQDIVALVIFLGLAVLISQLVGRAKAGQAMALARESETTRLYELSLSLAGVNDLEDIAALIAQKTLEALHPSHLELRVLSIYDQAPITPGLACCKPTCQAARPGPPAGNGARFPGGSQPVAGWGIAGAI